jgi:hypothetical protein
MLHRTKPEAVAPLASLLHELDIQPFDRESVELYKQEKKEKTFAEVLARLDPTGFFDWHESVMIQRLALDGRGKIMAPNASIADPSPEYDLQADILSDAADEGWDVRFYHDRNRDSLPVAVQLRWRRIEIAEAIATIGIPEFVFHKTYPIMDRAPVGTTMEVDALESKSAFYDPFLIVRLGEEEYYIEVWGDDEKQFQR